jgi:hypothetical protein
MQYESDTKSQKLFWEDHGYALLSNYFRDRKMNNFNDEGRVYWYFYANQSLVSLLYFRPNYPANAGGRRFWMLCISKQFLKLITETSVSIKIIEILARRYKSVMAAEISTHDSEHRLLQLFDYSILILISKRCKRIFYWFDATTNWGFNGPSVETVIRTIKH